MTVSHKPGENSSLVHIVAPHNELSKCILW